MRRLRRFPKYKASSRVSMHLPEKMHDEIRKVADENGISISQLIGLAVSEYWLDAKWTPEVSSNGTSWKRDD